MKEEFELIAKTFQGLEEVLAKELTELGASNIEVGRRMVAFTGDKEMMYRANFCLRTAIRILKPIKHFEAKNADEVYEAIKAIAWEDFLDKDKSFAVDAVVFSNEFRHSKFVAYKVKDAIVDYFREKTGERPSVRINHPDVALNIHIAENKCTLSLDSSGESLHRRGYRQEAVEAPLNEVLAAGMILMTGWKGECDLIDPMCGSGTIPIEAALIARNIAPGVFRKEFAFEKWNDFDQELFDRIYNDDSQEREFTHKIFGYDNNPKANEIATHNVKAAGLSKEIILKIQPFQQFEQPKEKSSADLIELGIPFSDPTAEGPVIQAANLRALKGGITTDKIFAFVRELRKDIDVPFVFMTYTNVVFSYGVEKFVSECQKSRIDGLILPDLPFEEKEEFHPICAGYGVDLISMVAPTSEKRIAKIAGEAEGFLYVVSSLGVTGMRSEITTDLTSIVATIRENTRIPCAVGFGISTTQQAAAMAEYADGVIVGSAIVTIMEKYGKNAPQYVGDYVKEMKKALSVY